MYAYDAATTIHATPDTIWQILVNAPSYTSWNPTIARLDGTIAQGGNLKLVAKVAPDQTFDITVAELEPSKRMVWKSGNPFFFGGQRTFSLEPQADGSTRFSMREEFSGLMVPMIFPSMPNLQPAFDEFASSLKKKAETASR